MPRVLAIACVALAALCHARDGALDANEMQILLGWASHFSGRPLAPTAEIPVTSALSAEVLARTVCPEDLARCRRVVAAYDAEHRRIVHLDTLDIHDPVDRSFLVHELVHYLQHLQRGDAFLIASCSASLASEREAYRAQDRYLAHVGHRRRAGQVLLFTHCDDGETPSRAARD